MADKLKITMSSDSSKSLDAQYNPEMLSLTFSSTKGEASKSPADAGAKEKEDKTKQKKGQTAAAAKPATATETPSFTKDATLSFDLIFDNSFDQGGVDVSVPVTFLNNLFYNEGDTAVTPKVNIVYGKYINFTGTPSALTLAYLLFNAEGYPIRIKASLTFSGTNNSDTSAKRTMGKTIETETDSSTGLANYAEKKLGDAALYTAVAAANKLPNLMKLAPGVKLKIPKL